MRLLFLGIAAALLCAGCGEPQAPPPPPGVEVTVLKIVPVDTPVTYEFVGQTESAKQVQIVARVSGFLDEQIYTEGSLVAAGEVLFQQDPKPFRAQLNAAKGALAAQQARLEVARANLARVQPLVEQNALSQKDLDDAVGQEKAATAAVAIAQAEVETAQLNLSYTTITSPVAGVSSFARVNVGSYLDARNSLLTYVSPLDPLFVNFSVSENEMLSMRDAQRQGQLQAPQDNHFEVEVVLADGSVFDQKGRITFRDADFDQQTGTFLVRATLPNPEGDLRPGQFVRVHLLGAFRPQAVLVPQESVLQGAKGHFVMVVDADNKAQVRPVEVGPWLEQAWFINQGLDAGDTVVVEGVARLSPGTLVKIVTDADQANDDKKSAADAAATR